MKRRSNEEMKRKAMKLCTDEDMKINEEDVMKRRTNEDEGMIHQKVYVSFVKV